MDLASGIPFILHQDLNEAFAQMYEQNDFSIPACDHNAHFTQHKRRDLPRGLSNCRILTVANYDYQATAFERSQSLQPEKKEILDSILDVVENTTFQF